MRPDELLEEAITREIIGSFFEVYNSLGFGHFEHIYVLALEHELAARKLSVGREVSVQVFYKGLQLGVQRLDMVVGNKVIVEVKSTYELHRAAKRQVFSYLRATRLEVGLLLHFGPDAKFYRMVASNPHSIGSIGHIR